MVAVACHLPVLEPDEYVLAKNVRHSINPLPGGISVLRRQPMTKVQILTTCSYCQGGAVLSARDEPHAPQIPCPMCDGSGLAPRWISLQEFAILLAQAQCPPQHTSYKGGLHFSAGDAWDDISEVCNDCGAVLDRQTLNNNFQALCIP